MQTYMDPMLVQAVLRDGIHGLEAQESCVTPEIYK